MGALGFLRSFFGGNPPAVVKLGKGDTGAVKSPILTTYPSSAGNHF